MGEESVSVWDIKIKKKCCSLSVSILVPIILSVNSFLGWAVRSIVQFFLAKNVKYSNTNNNHN